MLSGLESPAHLVVLLVIAMLLLGPKRLPQAARSLGSGIRQFKNSVEGGETRAEEAAPGSKDTASPDPPADHQ